MTHEHSETLAQDPRAGIGTEAPIASEGTVEGVSDAIRRDGFAYLPAPEMCRLAGVTTSGQWTTFSDSWNGLETDRFMKDGGTYRRRRHAVFSAGRSGLERQPDRPHFQELTFNHLNGGVSRSFAPVAPEIVELALTKAVILSFVPVFQALSTQAGLQSWEVEMHQFRIEADPNRQGCPTPEGLHRDGVDWVAMALINRTNVSGGITSIETADGTPLAKFQLEAPFDAIVLDDRRLRHGASPISVLHPGEAAHRDMLVLTYKNRLY